MVERKINVAVIGVGAIAKSVHIPAYLSNGHANLIAVVDKDFNRAKKIARKFHIKRAYQSSNELFKNERIDAISLCTPPFTHEEICLEAFEHGAHVLCEKPLATKLDSGRKMVRGSKSKKRILMVGFHRRFLANYQLAKQNVLEGRLGKVYCVEDHFMSPHPLFGWARSPWYVEPGIGGVISDVGSHVFDMLNYVFNDFPTSVSAYCSTHLDSPVEELCSFIVEYPKNRIGMGTISWQAPTLIDYTNIYGTAQSLYVSPKFFLRANPCRIEEISLFRAAAESLLSMKFPNLSMISTKRSNPYKCEIDSFIEQVRTEEITISNALNALSVLSACEATRVASKKNCKIEIPSPERL